MEVRNLTKKYYAGTAESKVVDHADIAVDRGEFVVIMGASGSGKTSLLHLIAGIDRFDEGSVKYYLTDYIRPGKEGCAAGCPDKERSADLGSMNEKAKTMFRRANIGIVFQQQCLIPDLTVYENIMLPLMLVRRPAEGRKHKDIIFDLCSRFGLKEHVRKYPSQLSGGQQQRAAILRSVVNKPPLLLCDEPTGSLNSAQTELVMDLLKELNQSGQTIILVTHDRKVAARGKRVVYIEDGRIEGELRFPETEPADTGGEGMGDRERQLMRFLQKRGW